MTFTWATQHDDSEVDFAIEKSTAETEHPTMNRGLVEHSEELLDRTRPGAEGTGLQW
jgi:hypothetical protein